MFSHFPEADLVSGKKVPSHSCCLFRQLCVCVYVLHFVIVRASVQRILIIHGAINVLFPRAAYPLFTNPLYFLEMAALLKPCQLNHDNWQVIIAFNQFMFTRSVSP